MSPRRDRGHRLVFQPPCGGYGHSVTVHHPLDEFPRFSPAARLRPVALVQPGASPPVAPYLACEVDLAEQSAAGVAEIVFGADAFSARWNGRTLSLRVTRDGAWRNHTSRRHGTGRSPDAVAVTLTGPFVTGWLREDGAWVARAVVDLALERNMPDVHDEAWLAQFAAIGDRSGCFGQLGLRDVRLATYADGSPYLVGGELLLTATSAGPGGFRTAHTSVWSFAPDRLETGDDRPDPPRRPLLPATAGRRATRLLRRPRGPPRARRRALAGRRQHVGHLRRQATPPRRDDAGHLHRGPHPGAAPPRHRGAGPPHHRVHVRGVLGPPPGAPARRRGVARRLRQRRALVPLPPGPGGRGRPDVTEPARGRRRPCRVRGHHPHPSRRHRGGCSAPTVPTAAAPSARRTRSSTSTCSSRASWTPTTPPTSRGRPCGTTEHTAEWWLIGFEGTPYGGHLLGYGTHGDIVVQRAR